MAESFYKATITLKVVFEVIAEGDQEAANLAQNALNQCLESEDWNELINYFPDFKNKVAMVDSWYAEEEVKAFEPDEEPEILETENPQLSRIDLPAQNLRVEDVAAYLHKNGWQRTPHPNDRLLVFTGGRDDQGHPLELILPQHSGYEDAPLRMSEAINLLAAVERKTPQDVIQAIRALDRNIL